MTKIVNIKRLFRKPLPWVLSIIMLAATIISPMTTFAESDPDYLSSQNILFYNPNDVDCSTDSSDVSSAAVSADENANAKTIFEFLVSTNFTTNGNKPMTAIQAAGVLGNIQTESGFNPAAIQHPPYDPVTAMNAAVDNGFGIVQWSFARRVNLLNFATNANKDWKDLGLQLTFLEHELNTSNDIFNVPAFANAASPTDAANSWNKSFEGSADTSSNRGNQAEAWYTEFKDLAPVATNSDTAFTSDCSSGTGSAGTGQCNASSCTTGDGTAASVVSAAMSMVLPDSVTNPQNGGEIGYEACHGRGDPSRPGYNAGFSGPSYCSTGPAQPATYATALKQYNIPPSVANQYYGACCATFVSTVLQVAGVESGFSSCGAAAVHDYLASHPELFQHVASGVTAITSQIQPGDILANDSDVYIYVGGNNVAGASYGDRMPDLQPAWQDGPRDVYRVIKVASS